MVLVLLGVVLLPWAALALGNGSGGTDSTMALEQTDCGREYLYLVAAAGGLLLFLAFTAWRVAPLLLARSTITVDYLTQANEISKPAGYDPNRNAAPYYEEFFSQVVPLPDVLKDKWASWPTDLSAKACMALDEWAALYEPALSVLAPAIQCPYWWYELKSADGSVSGLQTPYREQRRHCAWGTVLLAKYRAARGDTNRAFGLLADLHAFARHQVQNARLVEQMIGMAICKLSYDSVASVLAHGTVETEVLKQALDRFTQQVPAIVAPRFFPLGDILDLYGHQRLFTDDGHGNGRLIPWPLYKIKKSHPHPYSRPISLVDAVFICLAHPDRRSTLCSSETLSTLLRELADQTPWELHVQNISYEQQLKTPCFGNYVLHDSLAATIQCLRIGWRTRVTGEATTALLAIFTYQAQEARLPESLGQLVDTGLLPSVPMDPYSAEPLVYRVNGDDFTLYSVGEDFVDNGGMHCEWDDQRGGDHVFWPVPVRQ